MVYHGKVQNGVIVIEGSRLAEGTRVRVEPESIGELNGDTPRQGSPEAILSAVGIWADQKEDMDRSLAELKAMKEAEVRRQMTEPVPEL